MTRYFASFCKWTDFRDDFLGGMYSFGILVERGLDVDAPIFFACIGTTVAYYNVSLMLMLILLLPLLVLLFFVTLIYN
jgi:hypothetical protein